MLDIPELVWDTYKNALSTFREVSNITVQYQNQLLRFDLRDIALFQLFPTVEQLKALPPSKKPSEKPYKPKSRPRAPDYGLPPTSKSAQLKKGPWD